MVTNDELTIDMNQPEEQLAAQMSAFLPHAAKLANVPVSGFRVGAAALGASGRVWLGANQEFAQLPHNFTVHAEQAAVLNARSHGETKLLMLAVSAPPCGYCRQFLRELKPPLEIVLDGRVVSLDALLPEAFALSAGEETLLSEKAGLSFSAGSSLKDAALAAARVSYSPYTGTKSGAALLCASGKIFCGSLLESAAYNPSLSALQSAFTLRALGGASGDPVRRCVLAETGPAAMGEVFLPLMRILAPEADCELFDIDD